MNPNDSSDDLRTVFQNPDCWGLLDCHAAILPSGNPSGLEPVPPGSLEPNTAETGDRWRRRLRRPSRMAKSRRKKKSPKRVLVLPDLEQTKSAVLNTLTSKSGQRTYDHAMTEFVQWYCSEPRLAFNRAVVLRYRISLEQKQFSPSIERLPDLTHAASAEGGE